MGKLTRVVPRLLGTKRRAEPKVQCPPAVKVYVRRQISDMEKGLTMMGWAIWLQHTWTQLGPLSAAADICSTLADDSVVLGNLWDDRGVRTFRRRKSSTSCSAMGSRSQLRRVSVMYPSVSFWLRSLNGERVARYPMGGCRNIQTGRGAQNSIVSL